MQVWRHLTRHEKTIWVWFNRIFLFFYNFRYDDDLYIRWNSAPKVFVSLSFQSPLPVCISFHLSFLSQFYLVWQSVVTLPPSRGPVLRNSRTRNELFESLLYICGEIPSTAAVGCVSKKKLFQQLALNCDFSWFIVHLVFWIQDKAWSNVTSACRWIVLYRVVGACSLQRHRDFLLSIIPSTMGFYFEILILSASMSTFSTRILKLNTLIWTLTGKF